MIHRLAWATLVSLIVLILVGAVVRVTGSGLGCPDWPTCWGCLIPPTSVDQIDVEKLDIDKFKRYASRHGIDPDSITKETVLDSFNPVHTWIEFCNRLTSLPLGICSLLLALSSFRASRSRGWIILLSWLGLIDVLGNAVMGAMVVRSGLQPGIITLHMALAFLLIIILVTIIWLSRTPREDVEAKTEQSGVSSFASNKLLIASLVFFACLFAEGLMGSQVREQTDELAKIAAGDDRHEWASQLESTWIYKVHRSFSWTLLVTAIGIFVWGRTNTQAKTKSTPEPKLILALVVAMMIMGVVMAHVSVFQVVQVAHVGSTAVLLAISWHWLLRLFANRTIQRLHQAS
ncbi:MAG: heme A synthase [Mariniblastus sp.]